MPDINGGDSFFDTQVLKGAGGDSFFDMQVLKDAGGDSFLDTQVLKDAGGDSASVKNPFWDLGRKSAASEFQTRLYDTAGNFSSYALNNAEHAWDGKIFPKKTAVRADSSTGS